MLFVSKSAHAGFASFVGEIAGYDLIALQRRVLANGNIVNSRAALFQVEPEALSELQLGPAVLTPSRNNGFLNMLEAMRKRARVLAGAVLPTFPSLRISAAEITPQGAFAEAQAQFLQPDPKQVNALVKVGVCVGLYCVAFDGLQCSPQGSLLLEHGALPAWV